MKKLLIIVLIFLSACTRVAPDAGIEAVLIKKPWFFGHGGVVDTPVKTGLEFVAFTTEKVYVDMRPLQQDLKVSDMMSADGVPLHFDAIIRFRITDSVKLVTKFGDQYYDKNVQQEFFNQIRQQIRQHGMNDMAINTRSVEDVDRNVGAGMRDYFKRADLPLELIAVTVGKVDPPDSVRDQRIETARQEQRVNTERQRKLAEDSRKQAEESRAKSDDAYRTAMQLTPNQFVQLEQIKMLREACVQGDKICTFILNGGVVPTISIK